MLVVAGIIRMDPSDVDKAVDAAKAVMAETIKEPGCQTYVFTRDLSEAGTFRIFEEWDDEDALGAHFKMPHMAEFQKVLGSLKITEVNVKRYDVSATSQLLPR